MEAGKQNRQDKVLLAKNPSFDLTKHEVRLWQFDLGPDRNRDQGLISVLSADERQRAARFATKQLGNRFIACRGQLRLVLSRYLFLEPSRIRFVVGGHGKPRLADTSSNEGLVFNLSHSGDKALLAIGMDQVLGVDLEVWRNISNPEALVERLFTPSEKAYWYGLVQSKRQAGFFRIWTCKESFVKAVGKGIVLGMNNCTIEIGESSIFTQVPAECGRPNHWKLDEIPTNSGMSAALTVKDPGCRVLYCGVLGSDFALSAMQN